MLSSTRSSIRLVLASSCLFGFLSQVLALDIEYCAGFNTASTSRNSSIYQSNGLCHDFCIANYAFAVVQSSGCWCSNYAPDTTTTGCSVACPGYPSDICGGDGVYGYIALSKPPSGTRGQVAAPVTTPQQQVSTVTESSIVTRSPDPVTTTVIPPPLISTFTTIFVSEPVSSSISTSVSIKAPEAPVTTPNPSSQSTHPTWTPTPVISLETVTGQVRTVTVTPTVPPNSQNLNGVPQKADNHGSGGLSTGGAVGLTIGLVALVAIVCSITYCCWRKRKQQQEEYNSMEGRRDSNIGLGGPTPSRTMSENSRYVLGTDGRQVVETWENDGRDEPGTRTSRLMPVDPRLDPFAPVYQRGENKSRESVNTIRDDHDYSRRVHNQAPILRATNPDQ